MPLVCPDPNSAIKTIIWLESNFNILRVGWQWRADDGLLYRHMGLIERLSSVPRLSFSANEKLSHLYSHFFKPAIHDLRAGRWSRGKHAKCWIVRVNVLNFVAFF